MMPTGLQIALGQYSDRGRKEINQDFYGALLPDEPLLGMKGIAILLADGISSSPVSQIAAEFAVKGFLTDYYCTSETWSVKTSAQRVLAATNSWLYAQTRQGHARYDTDKGYVCTLSALVLKASTAHLFHIGDLRIYRMSGSSLEQLTNDHRVVVSSEQSYLSRALGVSDRIEIEHCAINVGAGDVFLLATDGIDEHVTPRAMVDMVVTYGDNLNGAAQAIGEAAFANGSSDNLTIQLVRVLAVLDDDEFVPDNELPPAPLLEARMLFDGYRISRTIHSSSRSHIYLAIDEETEQRVALKVPSIDLRGDANYLRRFMMEEWVVRRLDSPHVLKPIAPVRRRSHLYVAMEFIEGQTLTQWMHDNPHPDLETVRLIVEQIAKGLRAFHRKEMLHQDLRPENIMIDRDGTVKIIDFGSVRVTGVAEFGGATQDDILGTVQYTAPEYFTGEPATPRSDQFSLAVIAYQMLTRRLPYGAGIVRAGTASRIRKLRYVAARDINPDVPAWVDMTLARAAHLNPAKRYDALSEFTFDLRRPNPAYLAQRPTPLIERNPLLFWKCLSLGLGIIVLVLLLLRLRG